MYPIAFETTVTAKHDIVYEQYLPWPLIRHDEKALALATVHINHDLRCRA